MGLMRGRFLGSEQSTNSQRLALNRNRRRQLGLECLESRRVLAAFDLVRDINQEILSDNITWIANGTNTALVAINTPSYGEELWRSDGTPGGTYLLKDINPGKGNSVLREFETLGATTYFVASDGSGFELWKTDGTPAGTQMVKDINPTGSAMPSALTVMAGQLYFSADDGVNGRELWKTDGSAAGTVMVRDIVPGAGGSQVGGLHLVNGLLFFAAANAAAGLELWRSDGTAVNTFMVKDIRPGAFSSSPQYLTNVSGTLYFMANDGSVGYELWKSDGTNAGTVLVEDIRSGSFNSNAEQLTNIGGTLYFRADDGVAGYELWKSNGTPGTTSMVKDIFPGAEDGNPGQFINLNGVLVFTASDNLGGWELWRSSGTVASTVRIVDIAPGVTDSIPLELTNVNGTIFFSANDQVHGTALWRTNGTAAGTFMLEDINPGVGYGPLRYFENVNGTLYFEATHSINGAHLWKSNGVQTTQVSPSLPHEGSNVVPVMTQGDDVLFFADPFSTGSQLWKSDGTYAGTHVVKDQPNLVVQNSVSSTAIANGLLYFLANDGTSGYELWRSDGTSSGTFQVVDLRPGSSSPNISQMVNVDGMLYFMGDIGTGPEIWKSNGTASGSIQVTDDTQGFFGISGLTNFAGELYFTASNGLAGGELWKTNGTETGTVMVRDIATGPSGSYPLFLTPLGNLLYFQATDGVNGREIWKTNGTHAGTAMVSDFQPPAGIAISFITAGETKLFLRTSGLFSVSDGTLAGSVNLKSFVSQGLNSPTPVTVIGDIAYFMADDGVSGNELWKSDGTVAGTVLVKDINPGKASSNPVNLKNINGVLYFSANNGVEGEEIWTSDGTLAGTTMRSNLAPGSAASSPSGFTLAGKNLFVSANTPTTSRELFVQSTDIGVHLTGAGPRSTSIRRNGGMLEVVNTTNGTTLNGLELDFARSVTFTGVSTSDTVTIDYAFGGFFALPDGLHVNGNSGSDTLNVVGTSGITAKYIASGAGLGQATIEVQQGAVKHSISLTGFENLSIDGMLAVSTEGNVTITSQTLTVGSTAPLNLGNVTQLSSGTLNSSSAVALGAGEVIIGNGNVLGRVAADIGSSIIAQGLLVLGADTSVAGFATQGDIQVGSNTMILLDANQALLGQLTTLGTAASPGNLLSSNGMIVDFGDNVTGYGTLNSINNSSKPFINNGAINGTSVAQPITMTGFVKGVGSLNNVNMLGTYSPGLSPAAVNLGSMAYGAGSTTIVELGGVLAGAHYDQLNHTGQASLGGTLTVELIDGFVPAIGNTFTILTASDSVVGTFASIDLPTLPAGLDWQVQTTGNSVQLKIVELNIAPTDVQLSATDFNENLPVGTTLGMLSSVDPNVGSTFSYALVSGQGSTHNSNFTVDGTGALKNVVPLDFESLASLSIRVRTTDEGGLFFEKTMQLTVVDLPELVGSPLLGDGSAQRSLVKQIMITFDGPVDILSGAFAVNKRGPGGGAVDFTITPSINSLGQTEVQLTFSGAFTRAGGALIDGYYELIIEGSRILRGTKRLDANQDGIEGDQFIRGAVEADNFFALFGDTNGDGLVGVAEFGQFRNSFGKQSSDPGFDRLFDYDGDGTVGVSDFGQFRNRFGKPKMTF